jgi:hypothetical protein
MKSNTQKYFREMYEKSKNPIHKDYYKRMMNGGYSKSCGSPTKIFSTKLNKSFDTMAEASRYVGKSKSYCYMVLKDELPNTYGFMKI